MLLSLEEHLPNLSVSLRSTTDSDQIKLALPFCCVTFHVGDERKTRGIFGEKGKGRSTTDSPRCTHTDNEGEDDQEYLFDFSKGASHKFAVFF